MTWELRCGEQGPAAEARVVVRAGGPVEQVGDEIDRGRGAVAAQQRGGDVRDVSVAVVDSDCDEVRRQRPAGEQRVDDVVERHDAPPRQPQPAQLAGEAARRQDEPGPGCIRGERVVHEDRRRPRDRAPQPGSRELAACAAPERVVLCDRVGTLRCAERSRGRADGPGRQSRRKQQPANRSRQRAVGVEAARRARPQVVLSSRDCSSGCGASPFLLGESGCGHGGTLHGASDGPADRDRPPRRHHRRADPRPPGAADGGRDERARPGGRGRRGARDGRRIDRRNAGCDGGSR